MSDLVEKIARVIGPGVGRDDPSIEIARAVLARIEAEGMVIVPSRPTMAMRIAMWEAHKIGDAPSGLYDAAIAAAPKG